MTSGCVECRSHPSGAPFRVRAISNDSTGDLLCVATSGYFLGTLTGSTLLVTWWRHQDDAPKKLRSQVNRENSCVCSVPPVASARLLVRLASSTLVQSRTRKSTRLSLREAFRV